MLLLNTHKLIASDVLSTRVIDRFSKLTSANDSVPDVVYARLTSWNSAVSVRYRKVCGWWA